VPRAGLSRKAVVDAALAVADEGGPGGFDSLTLAAVAARTRVAVPSLYKHVGGLDDLRRGVAVVSVRELTRRIAAEAMGRSGPDAVRAVARGIRSYATEHPALYAAAQHAADPLDPADAELAAAGTVAVDATATVLRGFGLPESRTVDAVRMLRACVHGFVVLEQGGGFGLPDSLDASFDVVVDTVVAGIERLGAD
jgi:AcrR family transcriptional regulator